MKSPMARSRAVSPHRVANRRAAAPGRRERRRRGWRHGHRAPSGALVMAVVRSEPFQMRTATGDRAMTDGGRISRRTVLRGLGTAVALPFLEAMCRRPAGGWCGGRGPAAAADGLPLRAQRRHHGRLDAGDRGDRLRPAGHPQPLAPFRQDLLVLSGLTCDKARPNGDGAGDHARRRVGLPDRLPGRARPPGPTSGPASRPTRSPPPAWATGRGSPRWSWASSATAGPATATAATPSSTKN